MNKLTTARGVLRTGAQARSNMAKSEQVRYAIDLIIIAILNPKDTVFSLKMVAFIMKPFKSIPSGHTTL